MSGPACTLRGRNITNSKILYLWLLILFVANGWWCCYCCWNEERTALLQLKENIKYSIGNDYLSSWGANETSDCCQWEGIVCSNTTRRVIELSIAAKEISQEEQLSTLNGTYTDDILRNWLFNASLFVPFKNLKALLLPGHSLAGWVKNEGFEKLRRLRKLEVLDLSGNSFNRSIFESLSQLPSLKSLNLSQNQIGSGSDIGFGYNKPGPGSERLSGLDKLEILDLNYNYIEDENVLSALELNSSRTALKKLDLRNNRFQSFMPNEALGALRNIEYLLLDGNTLDENFLTSSRVMSSLKVLSVAQCNLNGTLPLQGLCDLKYLEELSLSRNSFIGTLPTCLGNLTYLRVIDLTQNQFTGNVASSPLSRLLSLEYLLIANNNFEIPISFASFGNHSKLKFVIADYNSVIVQTTAKSWIPKFQLEALSLFNCSQMPNFLHYQHHLRLLRLSRCNIGGDFPNWLLENNSILGEVYLDGNAFAGSLQLPFLPNLKALDISNNKIQGQLPPDIGSIFPNLVISKMSNNMLEGLLPSSFADMKNLECLDLSYNKLNGELAIGLAREGSKLYLLRLSNNKLKGEIFPVSGQFDMFANSSDLKALNLGDNNFNGSIPKWLGSSLEITTLLLKGNHLQGTIPTELCHASKLRIMDLSHNNLSGPIPHCIGNIMQLTGAIEAYPYGPRFYFPGFHTWGRDVVVHVEDSMTRSTIDFQVNYAWVGADFTTKHNTYSYEGRVVDSMAGIDLSNNQLSGEIPRELCSLTAIVAHNNLTGTTPQRASQFATFTESTYEGNPFLCGPPLHNNCMETKEILISPPEQDCCEDNHGFLEMESFYISFLVAYANVVLALVVVLFNIIKVEGEWASGKTITQVNYEKRKRAEDVGKMEKVVAALSIKEKAPFIVITAPTQVYAPPLRKEFIVQTAAAQGMTRSGRCYIPEELTDKKDS
ncbi:hypothetical protein CQW23_32760 [Capsicum baccatum]|uniref:Leucine-rich repeat-containing N-terminal plant-type domain-containing protein n=1 Tax=Capsicum baccatum TaxID=33114 RepID=A0A2G2V3R7_CAPBA|nr:hypothetical protein CQW23_32760 [Capsicum baccatum]